MRVAAITPNYLPERVGAWLATHRLLVHLVGRGHQVNVYAIYRRERSYTVDGVRVFTGRDGRNSAIAATVPDADVVISHCGDGGDGLDIALEAGKPAVRMAHGAGIPNAKGAALVVFNSESLRCASGWKGDSIVVHPYTDRAEFATTPGDKVTLVNLSEAKGGRLFDRLTRSMGDCDFLAVKGGYGAQVVPRHPNVETIPATSNMRDDVYARTRLLLMPSAVETWGMTAVEAMIGPGVPVIAHPTPGLVESLGDAGIFVDRDNHAGWANAIRHLDDPAAYEAACQRSRRRAAELIPEMEAGLDRFAEAVEAIAR